MSHYVHNLDPRIKETQLKPHAQFSKPIRRQTGDILYLMHLTSRQSMPSRLEVNNAQTHTKGHRETKAERESLWMGRGRQVTLVSVPAVWRWISLLWTINEAGSAPCNPVFTPILTLMILAPPNCCVSLLLELRDREVNKSHDHLDVHVGDNLFSK